MFTSENNIWSISNNISAENTTLDQHGVDPNINQQCTNIQLWITNFAGVLSRCMENNSWRALIKTSWALTVLAATGRQIMQYFFLLYFFKIINIHWRPNVWKHPRQTAQSQYKSSINSYIFPSAIMFFFVVVVVIMAMDTWPCIKQALDDRLWQLWYLITKLHLSTFHFWFLFLGDL